MGPRLTVCNYEPRSEFEKVPEFEKVMAEYRQRVPSLFAERKIDAHAYLLQKNSAIRVGERGPAAAQFEVPHKS